MLTHKPYITDIAHSHGELAKKNDKDHECRNEFWYWLGYYTGQDSIANPKGKRERPQ
jgi:hypothetical protein